MGRKKGGKSQSKPKPKKIGQVQRSSPHSFVYVDGKGTVWEIERPKKGGKNKKKG